MVPKWLAQPWYPIFCRHIRVGNAIEFEPDSNRLFFPFQKSPPDMQEPYRPGSGKVVRQAFRFRGILEHRLKIIYFLLPVTGGSV